jgi:hypothetical protein
VPRWAVVPVAVLALAGCSPAGAVEPRLAPPPSSPLVTPEVTVTRTDRSGTSQSIHLSPDGEWLFVPYPGSPWARVVNYGRLDPPQHERLAVLLDTPALSGRATWAPVPCPGGYRYRLDAGTVSVAWTDCDTEDQPALGALLGLLTDAQPTF